MPQVFPFRAISYAASDVSSLVAPPYDVLDSASKSRLLEKERRNIVAIDLPHTPAKQLGPPEAYAQAAQVYRRWLDEATLVRRAAPAIFAYRQRYKDSTLTARERCGVCCTVEALPFGRRAGGEKDGNILPHEETFSGPKEDRLALMRATRAQLSPIFGLHADDRGFAMRLIRSVMTTRPPDITGSTGDGVTHETWIVDNADTIREYQRSLANEDIFVADGHHRYTTQLNYIKQLEVAAGGPLPPDHPARRCMMVLVGMSDPGLAIWPTHRVLGGMQGYSIDAFLLQSEPYLAARPIAGNLQELNRALSQVPVGSLAVGLHDFKSGRSFLATPAASRPDPLLERFPSKPASWRMLDVAWVQHVIVEEICQARLNAGQPVKWAFPHTIPEVEAIGSGIETGAGGGSGFAQLAVIVRPTPLSAVRDISRAGELMPQKSTFFYPKLATGLWINPLD